MSYKLPQNCPYSVKSTKTFRGMEGYGFNAIVCLNDKKIGLAINDACGGPLMLEGFSQASLAALQKYVAQLPPYPAQPGLGIDEPLPLNVDCFLEEVVNAFEAIKLREKNRKKFEKDCKTNFMFKTSSHPKGRWGFISFTKATPERCRQAMEQKYGKIVVLNDLIATDPYAWEKF